MPFKSHAVKAQALLGAKEYVARVEATPLACYCDDGWWSKWLYGNNLNFMVEELHQKGAPVGCILTEAALAVLGGVPENRPDGALPHMCDVVSIALGLLRHEMTPIAQAHDGPTEEGPPTDTDAPEVYRSRVREAYALLEAVPVLSEEPTR
jgi:hypothetical protein